MPPLRHARLNETIANIFSRRGTEISTLVSTDSPVAYDAIDTKMAAALLGCTSGARASTTCSELQGQRDKLMSTLPDVFDLSELPISEVMRQMYSAVNKFRK